MKRGKKREPAFPFGEGIAAGDGAGCPKTRFSQSSNAAYSTLLYFIPLYVATPLSPNLVFGRSRRGRSALTPRPAFGSRLSCNSIVASCVRFTPVMQFYCRVLRSVHACHAVLLPRPAFGSRLSFFLCQEKRNGLRYVPFLFLEVRIASCKFSCLLMVIELCWFTSGLYVSLWRFRRGYGGTWGTESAVDVSAFLRNRIGFAIFSAGRTLGLRAPDCAKEPLALWTLFIGVAAKYSLPNIAIIAIP